MSFLCNLFQGKYKCTICGKKLKGKVLTAAKKRDKALQDPLYTKTSIRLSPELRSVYEFSNNANYCNQCYNSPENWDKNKKLCIHCNSFMGNFTGQPGLPDFYCYKKGQMAISNPLDNGCEDWSRLNHCFFESGE